MSTTTMEGSTAPFAGRASRLCWIYPDRGTERQRDSEAQHVWDVYKEIAEECGLRMSLHKPEAVAVDVGADGGVRVFLDGELVTPEDTVFVTSLWSLPHQTGDVCNELFLYTILEQAGFYLPIHPSLSYITTDKVATMLFLDRCPVPRVPTVRIGSGRDAAAKAYEAALDRLEFPAIVKPAYWGMGIGVCLVRNVRELRGVVGIAGGSDTALVCQPYLGEGVDDYRVYVIDGKVHTVLRRMPEGPSLTANLSSGGSMQFLPLPEELTEAVAYVAGKLPMPYLCVDFLHDGKQFWLSEVEPDGAVAFPDSEAAALHQRTIITARFEAYIGAHRRWIEDHRNTRKETP
jgi:RimK-like ATP-grasp domain